MRSTIYISESFKDICPKCVHYKVCMFIHDDDGHAPGRCEGTNLASWENVKNFYLPKGE